MGGGTLFARLARILSHHVETLASANHYLDGLAGGI